MKKIEVIFDDDEALGLKLTLSNGDEMFFFPQFSPSEKDMLLDFLADSIS